MSLPAQKPTVPVPPTAPLPASKIPAAHQDLSAEQATIGAVLRMPLVFFDVEAEFAEENYFAHEPHRVTWDAIKDIMLNEQNQGRLDVEILAARLEAQNNLQVAGGKAALLMWQTSVANPSNAVAYAKIVKDRGIRRRVGEKLREAYTLTLDTTQPASNLRSEVIQVVDAAYPRDDQAVLPGEMASIRHREIIAERERKVANGELIVYQPPAQWAAAKSLIPHIPRAEMIVITGKPGSGKSVSLEMIAEAGAMQGAKSTYYYNEMTEENILDRRLARHGNIPVARLVAGQLLAGDKQRQAEAEQQIAAWEHNIAYVPCKMWTGNVLLTHMRRRAMLGCRIFVIDHFNNIVITGDNHRGNEVLAREYFVMALTEFAETYKVMVVLGAQENDQGDVKWTKKVREQATFAMSIKRKPLSAPYEYVYKGTEYRLNPREASPLATWNIVKARFGATGSVEMFLHGPGCEWTHESLVQTMPAYLRHPDGPDDVMRSREAWRGGE